MACKGCGYPLRLPQGYSSEELVIHCRTCDRNDWKMLKDFKDLEKEWASMEEKLKGSSRLWKKLLICLYPGMFVNKGGRLKYASRYVLFWKNLERIREKDEEVGELLASYVKRPVGDEFL